MRLAVALALVVLGFEAAAANAAAPEVRATAQPKTPATTTPSPNKAAVSSSSASKPPASSSSKPPAPSSSKATSSSPAPAPAATSSPSSSSAPTDTTTSSLPSSSHAVNPPTSTTPHSSAPPPQSSSPPPPASSSPPPSSSPKPASSAPPPPVSPKPSPSSSPKVSSSTHASSSPPVTSSHGTSTPALVNPPAPSSHSSSALVNTSSEANTLSSSTSGSSLSSSSGNLTFTLPQTPSSVVGTISADPPSATNNAIPTTGLASSLPSPISDNSGAHSSILHNKEASALLFTFVGLIAALLLIGTGILLWKRFGSRSSRVTVSDMDEFRGFRRANSSASSGRGPQSSNSSARHSGTPHGTEEWHYQPQRLTQPMRSPAMATLATDYPVHRAIYPDVLPTPPPRQQYTIYPDILPPRPEVPARPRVAAAGAGYPRPSLPPPAARPSSPESSYDEESMYAGIHRRPLVIERRPDLAPVRSGVAY